MKRFLQFCFTIAFFALGFSQGLKPIAEKVSKSLSANKMFVKYNLFTADLSSQKQHLYDAAAEGITVMKLNTGEIQRITSEKPEALEMSFPFEGKTITVQLVRNYFLTNDFKVNTDKGYVDHNSGVFYQGIVKGDNESLVAISFFDNDIIGVTSIADVGNIVIGKAKNSENFVSYNDQKLKGVNPFSCGTDELIENQNMPKPSYDPAKMTSKKTENCVRIYYEVGFGPYTQNGSDVSKTVNWVKGMHNNISTLYANDGITVALSEVFVWTTVDPFTGSPSEILNNFRNTRTTFNGDVAQLLRNPATTSIAFVNALCGSYKYSYSGVNFQYSDVPTYSWNIEAMTHEIGHNLGSPHTHDCSWNGNNTRIDGCGPASGNAGNGTCPSGPLPSGGGTIMSYCHLVSSVGINFTKGFGEQPGALIRSTIDSKPCLGTDCITSCAQTILGLAVTEVTKNSVSATINDNTGSGWKYKLAKMDGTVVSAGTSNTKILNFTNLTQGNYYTLSAGNDCGGPSAYAFEQLVMTDADWCGGTFYTDSGGETGNYGNSQALIKTFYPAVAGQKLKLTFTEFNTEPSVDYIIVYDGPNIASPRFGNPFSGTAIPGPFESTGATGALTVRFISNGSVVASGWKANIQCVTLGTNENSLSNNTKISKTSAKGFFAITSKEKIMSYQVFDASGKMVKTSSKLNAVEVSLDLAAFPAGTYVVNVVTVKGAVTQKIIR